MKQLFIFLAFVALCACQENERLVYEKDMHDIYFPAVTEVNDSMFISLITADELSAAEIEVKLLGDSLAVPGKFKVEVVKDGTTAVEGKHYKALPAEFEFPAGKFTWRFPLQLIKGDKALEEAPVVLILRLVATPGIGFAYPGKSEIRVLIADMLRVPLGTGYMEDMGTFERLFGSYSRKKHEMIIELTGHDFWDGNYGYKGGLKGLFWEEEYYIPYARQLYQMITEQVILDENNKPIQPWPVP